MNILVPNSEEIAFKQCLEFIKLNPLTSSTYYSQLFITFKSLLDIDDSQRLDNMIKDIETWLSDTLNEISLQEAETRMYANMDLLAGFEVNGVIITQSEILSRLEQIRMWLTQKLYEYLRYIRFTSTPQIV